MNDATEPRGSTSGVRNEQWCSFGRSLLKIGGAVAVSYGALSTSDVSCASQIFEHMTTPQNLSMLAGVGSTIAGLVLSWRQHAP
jgi:hypothetical protein